MTFKNKQEIVHFFMGDRYFLVLPMIETILRNSRERHFFAIFCMESVDGDQYRPLFARYQSDRFVFVHDGRFSLLRALWRYRHQPILIHGMGVGWWLLALSMANRFASLSWVCWGNVPSLPGAGIRGRIKRVITEKGFQRFRRIVCLLDGDAGFFRKDWACGNVVVLPYSSDYLKRADEALLKQQKETGTPLQVLLGNSAHYIVSYSAAIDDLKKFSPGIHLTCMLNYGNQEGAVYEALGRKAFACFPGRYYPWTKIVPIDEYADYLKKQDVYVCYVPTQTGLGAIYHMLLFGKKVYLQGFNLEWIRQLGFVVFDASDISRESFETFSTLLSDQQKQHNFRLMQEWFDVDKACRRWEHLFIDLQVQE